MRRMALFGGSAVRTREFPAWPVFGDAEEKALLSVLRGGEWWSYSQGESSRQGINSQSRTALFEAAFAALQGAERGVACASGTAALEVALKAAGITPGDEVIVPPYTFVATAAAPLLLEAVPIFCDIQLETLNLDPSRLEQAITPKTRAIIPVHFAGMAADMQSILRIARRHGLFVLEDAAHAPGAMWRNLGVGTLGGAGTFSFQASKNITAGEGGMIVTNDQRLADLCESYVWAGREHGRPWYEHHRLGWNYRLTEFQAAILIEQLGRLQSQNERRMRNGLYLNAQLAKIPGIYPTEIPDWVTRHSFHIYVFRLDEREFGASRNQFLDALRQEGIPCSGGYAHPLYRNPMFLEQNFHAHGSTLNISPKLNYADFARLCPNAERACAETIWLEHRVLLDEPSGMEDIVQAVRKIYECRDQFR